MGGPRAAVGTLVIGAALGAAILPSAAQDPAAPPQFESGVDVVRVDVYPRRQDRIVEGLRREDFVLEEDGRRQTIQTFEFVSHRPGSEDARVDPRHKAEADRWVADPRRRVVVLYFDLYHTTRSASGLLREPIMAALEQAIGPTDLVAVMTPETPIGDLRFAQTMNTLQAELAEYWTWGLKDKEFIRPRSPVEARLAACADDRGYVPLLQEFRRGFVMTSLESLVTVLGSRRQERTHIIYLSEGFPIVRGGVSAGELVTPMGPGSIPTTPQFGRPAPDTGAAREVTCAELLLRLRANDNRGRFDELFRRANAANVSFSVIDVGGLVSGVDLASGQMRSPATPDRAMLRELADNTDGVTVVGTNDLRRGLTRIFDHTSAYYLLGYYSTNAIRDGKFRRISVSVTADGVDVTARRGYLAASSALRRAAEARPASPVVPPPVAAALGVLAKSQRGKDDELIVTSIIGADQSARVVVEIAPRLAGGGRWANGAAVDVAIDDGQGQARRANGRIAAGARSVVVEVPLPADETGPWRGQVTVSGNGGALSARFEVPARSDARFGPPRLSRASAQGRDTWQPTALATVNRADRLRLTWQTTVPFTEATVRLLDRRGQPLAPGNALVVTTDPAERTIDTHIYGAGLGEGEYVFEATAVFAGEPERQYVAFRVGR